MSLVVGINGQQSPLRGSSLSLGEGVDSSTIERVTADPRDAGLDREVGSVVLYVSGASTSVLVKQTASNYGWRDARESNWLVPTTAARFNNLTGLSPGAYYPRMNPTNSCRDAVGTAHLARNSTVDGVTLEGIHGSFFNAALSRFGADVMDPANTSFIMGGYFAVLDEAIGSCGLMGRTDGTADGFSIYWSGTALTLRVDDNAGNTFTNALTGTPAMDVTQQVYCILLQRDKTAAKWRTRVARPGFTPIAQEYNDTQGTLSFAASLAGAGAMTGLTSGGGWCGMLFQRVHADTEGSARLATISAGLGAE